MPVRAFLIGLPALFIGLTLWAAQQAKLNRAQRHGDLFALVSDPELPQANPYLPKSEAERQLVEMIHQPLLKLDSHGKIAPALAHEWRWLKRVTVWFETPQAASDAEQRLLALRQDRWPAWKLESVSRTSTELQFIYTDPLADAVLETLKAAKARVIPVSILRATSPSNAKALQATLLNLPKLAQPVHRSWRVGQDAMEMVLTQIPKEFELRLRQGLEKNLPGLPIKIDWQVQRPTLEEPLLEMTLGEAQWHDGTQVKASDVKATFEALTQTSWPLSNRAGLDVVHRVEVVAPNRLRLALSRPYGPAICAWVGLPILPAAWWRNHAPDAEGHVFSLSPPIGAGPCKVAHRSSSLLVLESATTSTPARRLSLIAHLSGFNAHLGFATNALDLYWPSTPEMPPQQAADKVQRVSPPRELIALQWNTRNEWLADLRVRQALSASVDRGDLIKHSLSGQGEPHGTFFAKDLWLSNNRSATTKDTSLAEHLLAAAGWLRNVQGIATMPGKTLELQLAVPSSDPALVRVAAALRRQWLAIGVQTKLHLLDPAELDKAIASRDFDALLSRNAPVTTWDLGPQWHSTSQSNVTGFSTRLLDLLIEALAQDYDPEIAAKHSQQAEAIILDNQAVLPLILTHETATLSAKLAISNANQTWTLGNALK